MKYYIVDSDKFYRQLPDGSLQFFYRYEKKWTPLIYRGSEDIFFNSPKRELSVTEIIILGLADEVL